jgi:hypothetical protein
MAEEELAARIWQRLGCWITGHDYAITSAQSRMFLRCRSCGLTSKGMDLVEHSVPRQANAPRAAVARGAGGQSHPALR